APSRCSSPAIAAASVRTTSAACARRRASLPGTGSSVSCTPLGAGSWEGPFIRAESLPGPGRGLRAARPGNSRAKAPQSSPAPMPDLTQLVVALPVDSQEALQVALIVGFVVVSLSVH